MGGGVVRGGGGGSGGSRDGGKRLRLPGYFSALLRLALAAATASEDRRRGKGAAAAEQLGALLAKRWMRSSDLFKGLDQDGSGLVDRLELASALPALGFDFDQEAIGALFAGCDVDGSGSIDLKELKRKLRVGAQGDGARASHVSPSAAVYKGKAAAAAEAAAATAAAATAAAARARRSREVPEQLPALLQRLIAHAPASARIKP